MPMTDSALRSMTMALLTFSCYYLSISIVACQEKEALAPTRVEDGAPPWLKSYVFKKNFSFVRLRYALPANSWVTDFPDADFNFSKRLRESTALNIPTDGIVLDPVDPKLNDYPFAYLSGHGKWKLSDPQVLALRRYLENGGFLMIDDSWGEEQWKNVTLQLNMVFPRHAPQELPLQHKIFHCVFDLTEKPQVFSFRGRAGAVTWDRPDAKNVSYQGITNDKGRLMVLICHNTDLADGWERVDDDHWYAKEFSEKRAFPMGINIVFYALTASD